jgi:DNA topoisomerase-2
MLNKITRIIYKKEDDNILEYLNDDGLVVEPIYYAPIIPMVLVNGTKGIGTGFSTDIMCYNPLEIIDYLKSKLNGDIYSNEFIPYYEGFNGKIEKIADGKFLIKGNYEKVGVDKIRVTELPIGFWTEDFKELLESLIEPPAPVAKDAKKVVPIVKDYNDMSKDTTVDFTITFAKGKLDELESIQMENGCNGVEKLLKLFTTNTSTNMHLFNAEDKLRKYDKIEEIIDDYYETRLNLYEERKKYLISELRREITLLSNKARYIKENLEGTIDLRKKKKDEVIKMLEMKNYDKIENEDDYIYLTRMPMDSVTEENVEKLFNEFKKKETELNLVSATPINKMWGDELDNLKKEYINYREERKRLFSGEEPPKKQKVQKVQKKIIKNQTILVDEF